MREAAPPGRLLIPVPPCGHPLLHPMEERDGERRHFEQFRWVHRQMALEGQYEESSARDVTSSCPNPSDLCVAQTRMRRRLHLSSSRRIVRCLVAFACWYLPTLEGWPAPALNGTVQTVTFAGPVTGRPVTFSLYLPPGYATGTNRYPVVFHLHGLGGMHNSQQITSVPPSHEAAVAAGLIEPCLIAFPDGYQDSFWADSANSDKPAETNVRLEIIPYLDANFRTAATREKRAIQGFSMGGFGAAKFATKFPELFSACVVYDGALLNWTQIQQRHTVIAAEVFDNSSTRFDAYSPWHWLTANGPSLRSNDFPVRFVVGALLTENRSFRTAVTNEGLELNYVETGLGHVLPDLLDVEGANSWAWLGDVFRRSGASTNELRARIALNPPHVVLHWPSAVEERFQIERRSRLDAAFVWQAIVTNVIAWPGQETSFTHTNALAESIGFYRVLRNPAVTSPPPAFAFTWDGTNFTYSDAQRNFTGILLRPAGAGPFGGLIVNHGAGGTATGYSLPRAREMSAWGLVCIAPNLTHIPGETNTPVMGNSPENVARGLACANVLASLAYVDTNRLAVFGHSMGAFATVGQMAAFGDRCRAASITGGGAIPDGAPGGTSNATPTISEAEPVRTPFLMIHCDGDPVVPPSRSQTLQQVLAGNGVTTSRILISSNSIPNSAHWHNIHNDPGALNTVLTNTRAWFQTNGVLP